MLEFNQSPFLKDYINFNTEKRKQVKNSFEKDFLNYLTLLFLIKQWKIYVTNAIRNYKLMMKNLKS